LGPKGVLSIKVDEATGTTQKRNEKREKLPKKTTGRVSISSPPTDFQVELNTKFSCKSRKASQPVGGGQKNKNFFARG